MDHAIVGGDVSGEERAAVAALYVAMMTDLSLDLIDLDLDVGVDPNGGGIDEGDARREQPLGLGGVETGVGSG